MLAIRSFINLIFLGIWTAFMVSLAVSLSVLLRDPGIFRRMQRGWARGLVRFWGVKVQISGAEHMDTAQSYVVMANHLSYVDIVVLFLTLPITPGFLAKRELMRVPFLASALRHGGHVIIDRDQHQSALQTIQQAAEQVKAGKTVLIFPEGTRGDSDTIGQFKRGGFHLAKAAAVPILPVGLRGSRQVFARGSLLIRPGKIEVHLGVPIAPEEVERAELGEMVAVVRAKVMELSAMPARPGRQGSPEAA